MLVIEAIEGVIEHRQRFVVRLSFNNGPGNFDHHLPSADVCRGQLMLEGLGVSAPVHAQPLIDQQLRMQGDPNLRSKADVFFNQVVVCGLAQYDG
ncbi:hypothetical protein D3C77_381180 [compost metagenome]